MFRGLWSKAFRTVSYSCTRSYCYMAVRKGGDTLLNWFWKTCSRESGSVPSFSSGCAESERKNIRFLIGERCDRPNVVSILKVLLTRSYISWSACRS
jgi:hypothetical protein